MPDEPNPNQPKKGSVMTIDQMIARKREEIRKNLEARSANVTELAAIRDKTEVTDQDEARATELRQANIILDSERSTLEVKVAEYEAERAADESAVAQSRVTSPAAPSPSQDRAPVVVSSEERTYAPHKERTFDPSTGKLRTSASGAPIAAGGHFARDVAAAFTGDYQARERLERHMAEERAERGADYAERAVGTGAFAGLTVPQYLTELYAPAVAANRPFANVCRQVPLPESGMTVNISRITTSTGTWSSSAYASSPLATPPTPMMGSLPPVSVYIWRSTCRSPTAVASMPASNPELFGRGRHLRRITLARRSGKTSSAVRDRCRTAHIRCLPSLRSCRARSGRLHGTAGRALRKGCAVDRKSTRLNSSHQI